MSIQYVNTGSSANAGNGDSIRLAFTKVNNNFALVATQVADLQQGKFDNITIAGTATFLDIISTGTAQLNNVSIAGTVSGTSTFQNIIVEQVATVNDLYANTIASTNTATFQDVIVNGALYGEFTFNTLNVATTITTNDLNVGNSISVGQYQFIQTNNLSQDFAIVKDDINGLTFVLRNVHADSFAEINLQDNIQGGLSIVHQDSTNNSGNYDAGQNYIFGQTPSDTLNIGKYSDINFYANEAQYYDPNAAGSPSISISKTDGTVSFGSDMVYMNGISFQVVSDGSALVNGIPIQGGSSGNGYTGSQGDIGDLGYTGSAGLSGYTGSQGITGLSGYTGSVGFGYSGSKGDTGPQGISVTLVGSTATSAGLPLTGNPGDGWIVNNTGHLWFWNTISGAWNDIGTIVGPQGNAGPRGDQGLPGNNGNNGYTGSFGLTGYTGSIGNTGYYGSAGYTGSAGAIGYYGSVGYTGSAGVAGTAGYWGSKGYTGSAGTNGTNGYTGSAGTNGTNGTNGFTGSSGAAGFTGSAGTNGTSGYYGSAGYTGSVGSRGLGGYTGSAGSGYTGSAGTDGAHGYTGSAGTAGYTGSAGSGYTGSAGANGAHGYTGSAGTAGYTGSAGVGTAGYTGSAGTDGANGYTGSRGIDANTANFVFTDNTMTVADNGVIDLATNGFTWTLGTDGTLNLPASPSLFNSALVQTTYSISLNANGSFYIFNSDGNLQFPNGSKIFADQYTTASTFQSLGDLNIKTAGDMGQSWTFGENSTLTLPNGGLLYSSDTDTVSLRSPNTGQTVSVNSQTVTIGADGELWSFSNTGTLTTPGSIVPNTDIAYDLGSPDKQWRHIYVNTGSIYLGGIKLSTENNQLSVTQVENIGGQETVVNNYALTNADRLVKDGQTLVLTTTTNGAAVIGVENTATDLIIGSIAHGLGIQSDGTTVLSSGYDTSSPLVLVGGVGDSEGQDGGDIVILGGYSNSGQLGSVYIEGQYAEILTLDGIVIGNGDNAPWFFDNSDQGLEFPDATKQYTAYQGSTIVSDTAPSDDLGRIWFNSTDGRAYVKYNDNWVDMSPQVIPSPETYLEGLTIEDTTIAKTTFNDSKSISIDNEGKIVVLKTTGELVVPGDVVPETTGTQKLGTTTKRWKEAHIDEIHTTLDGGGASTWLTAD